MVGFGVFALSWLLPNHYPPWINFHSEFLAFVGLAVLLGYLLRKPPNIISAPGIAVALVALAAIPWVQFVGGLVFFMGDALISAYYILGLAAAIAVGYSFAAPAKGKTDHYTHVNGFFRIAKMLLFAAMLSAIVGLLQWLSLTEVLATFAMHTQSGERVVANLGQPNQLATLQLMGIASLAFIFHHRGVGRLGLYAGVAFMTWCIVLTESRTALLSAVFMGLFFVLKRQIVLDRIPSRYVLMWLTGFAVAWVALPAINGFLYLTNGRTIALTDENGRALVWRQIVFAIEQSPWLGYGWNQTSVAQAVGAVRYPGDLVFGNAHNIFLDLFVWVGIPLGTALSVAVLYWFFTRARGVELPAALYAMGALLPLAVHSMLEFPFAYSYFLLAGGLLVGVVEATTTTTTDWKIPMRVGWGLLAVLSTMGGYISYEYLLVEEDYRVARFENLKIGPTPSGYKAPEIRVNTQLAALLAALRQPAVPAMSMSQLENLRQVSLRFGYRPLAFRYALALGLNGNPRGASQQMALIRSIFGESYYQLVKLEMQRLTVDKYPELKAIQNP